MQSISEFIMPVLASQIIGECELTEEQQNAVSFLLDKCLHSKHQFLALLGGAGTGKTTTLGHSDEGLIKRLRDAGLRVGVCATTHVAAQVVRESLGDQVDQVSTLASALGLKERRVGQKSTFVAKSGAGCWKGKKVWIVDESSMISEELFEEITKQTNTNQRVIFVGDPAQLPPVNEGDNASEAGLSPTMRLPTTEVAVLNKVHRYAGPLLLRATEIRQEPEGYRKQWKAADGKRGVIKTTACPGEFSKLFRAAVAADPEGDFRMLAYRNLEVDSWNKAAYEIAFGANCKQPFQQGLNLITRAAVKEPVLLGACNKNQLAFGSSEVIQIIGKPERDCVDLGAKFSYFQSGDPSGFVEFWRLKVYSQRLGERLEINALAPGENPNSKTVKEALDQIASIAKKTDVFAWQDFWSLHDFFANIQYGWASTVHRAQGRGFDTVFLDLADLHKPRCADLKRALIYTAATRARHRVVCIGE